MYGNRTVARPGQASGPVGAEVGSEAGCCEAGCCELGGGGG